jgi:hypothetical protein
LTNVYPNNKNNNNKKNNKVKSKPLELRSRVKSKLFSNFNNTFQKSRKKVKVKKWYFQRSFNFCAFYGESQFGHPCQVVHGTCYLGHHGITV